MRRPFPRAAFAAFALVCGAAFGWVGAAAAPVADAAGATHATAGFTRLVATLDAAPAVLAGGVDALTTAREPHPHAERIRELLAAVALATALFALIARRRAFASALAGAAHTAVHARGPRAPPV